MTSGKLISRRSALVTGAAGAIGVGGLIGVAASSGALLAGCTEDDCKKWSAEHEPKALVDSPGGNPSPTASDQGFLAVLADIPVGGAVTARTPSGEPIIVSRPTDTTAAAFSAKCTHKGCLVNPDGKRLRCPPHDGWFNATLGTAEDGPPKKSLRRINVTVVDGKVMLAS